MARGSESGASASRLTGDELGDMSDKDIEASLRQSQREDDEVDPAKGELITLGGSVESYVVPDDTVDELEAAADEADVEVNSLSATGYLIRMLKK